MLEIETDRMILRLPIFEDVPALAEIYSSQNVMRYIGSGNTKTFHQTELAVTWMMEEHLKNGNGLWTAILKAEQRVIGRCGLINHIIDGQPELEVAYLLNEAYWGNGLASEAAGAIRDHAIQALGAKRMVSVVHPDNRASSRVAEKIGMQFERTVSLNGIEANLFALNLP